MYSTDYVAGDVQGSDDIAEVKWFDLTLVAELMQHQQAASEHTPQLQWLLNKYLKE